jgi:DNA-binding response OmpR family regulator
VKEAHQATVAQRFDLYVIDIGLPDGSGLDLIRFVRLQHEDAAILMLTAEGSTRTKVTALDAGADDYLTKPFSLRELEARLRALTRRSGNVRELRCGDMVLDVEQHLVTRGEVVSYLPRKEFELLVYLVKNQGRVISQERMSGHVWGAADPPSSNALAVYIRRLRKVVEVPAGAQFINTVPGAGYALLLGVRRTHGRDHAKHSG